MKIRIDFVSNSSSSSFMLVGQAFDYDELEQAYNKLHLKKKNKVSDIPCDVAEALGLEYECGIDNYYEMYVLGLPFHQMKDNETKKQFMDRIASALSKAFDNVKVAAIVDGGYEG